MGELSRVLERGTDLLGPTHIGEAVVIEGRGGATAENKVIILLFPQENAVFCLPSVAAAARLKKLEALDRAPCLFFPLPPSPTDIEDEEDIIHRAYPLERFVRLSV